MVALLPRSSRQRRPGGASGDVPPDPITQPGTQPPPSAGPARAAADLGSIPPALRPARPVLTVFDVSPAAVAAARPAGTVVRFQVRDRARRVRVRLAFVSLADRTHLPRQPGRPPDRRRALVLMARAVAAGRIPRADHGPQPARQEGRAQHDRAGRSAPPPVPATAGAHRFPVAGPYTFGGAGRALRRRAQRPHPPGPGRRGRGGHAAAWPSRPARSSGAPTRPAAPATTSCSTPTARTTTTSSCTCSPGSLLVGKGDRVAAGQQIAKVGNTGGSRGPAPALRGLGRPLVRRRPPGRPAPVPEVLGRRSRRYHPASRRGSSVGRAHD